MSKLQTGIMVAVSVILTTLVIGWVNDLDYWRRLRAINSEITRPAEAKESPAAREVSEVASLHEYKESPAPPQIKSEKPTDKEVVESWLNGVKALRARDPNAMPPVYTRLSELKNVQSCAVVFTVLQIDDANARIIYHLGERIWLTGNIPGMVENKTYTCKGLFVPSGTYQFKGADGTKVLNAYRYLGEAPDVVVAKRW